MDSLAKFRLPLFPLPVVLFPTATMPLHIFEPRCRRMVARCLEQDRRFGLVHHDADRQGPFLMEERRVGCVASIESDEPFYEAMVSAYADDGVGEGMALCRSRVLALFREVVRTLGEEPEWVDQLDVRSELSFPLVKAVQAEPAWLQGFLAVSDEEARLGLLEQVFLAVLGH